MNDSGAAIFRYDEPTGSDYRRLRDKYGGGTSAAGTAPEGDLPSGEDVGGGIDLYVIETPVN